MDTVSNIELNTTAYVDLLREFISVSKQVQNAPGKKKKKLSTPLPLIPYVVILVLTMLFSQSRKVAKLY
jgi:hypothetical protein